MEKFAFMLHPLGVGDFTAKFPLLKAFPARLVEKALPFVPGFKAAEIKGIKSPHNEAEGWFVGCPLTSRQLLELPAEVTHRKIIQAGRVAEKLGAGIVGLGAYTSIAGDAGITVGKNLSIAVTTGNSYTVATAVEGALRAAKIMEHNLNTAQVAVIGATGSIGRICSHLLAREVKNLWLVSPSREQLDEVASEILYETGLAARVSTNADKVLPMADVVLSVTNSVEAVIHPEFLKPGAVVCDVARPRDVSKRVVQERKDVLVIDGGIVEVPGDVDFGLNFGLPPKMAFACMAETIILSLEKRYENFTLGKKLTITQVEEISRLAQKHGFKLAGLRSFEKAVEVEKIKEIKNLAAAGLHDNKGLA